MIKMSDERQRNEDCKLKSSKTNQGKKKENNKPKRIFKVNKHRRSTKHGQHEQDNVKALRKSWQKKLKTNNTIEE